MAICKKLLGRDVSATKVFATYCRDIFKWE